MNDLLLALNSLNQNGNVNGNTASKMPFSSISPY